MLAPSYLTESTFRVRTILDRAILGRAVAANRPRDSDGNTLL